jgi:cardiolipin synthase (CMP-forming)
MNIPNLITLSRLLAVPVMVWLIVDGYLLAAFWLFVAAGISDALDGLVAKHLDAETELGRFLDPLADKALLVSVYVALGYQGYLEIWLVILVVFRDALIVGGAMLFHTLTQSLTMNPLSISKINTTAQIILAGVILAGLGAVIDFGLLIPILTYGVAVTTAASGVIYVVMWTRRATEFEGSQ